MPDDSAEGAAELPLGALADVDRDDRISREQACTLLDMPPHLFRRYYLIPAQHARSAERFGIQEDATGRVTLSRRLVLQHRDEAVRGLAGGPYAPPGWADRIRVADAAIAAYEKWERRSDADAAVEQEPPPADPQGDLFTPP